MKAGICLSRLVREWTGDGGRGDRLEGWWGKKEMEGLDETFQCVSSSLTFCRA